MSKEAAQEGPSWRIQRRKKHLSTIRHPLPAMPAKSKKQQRAAGAALSAKRGERSKKSLKGASKEMVKSMTEKELEDLASTKHKNLPEKKGD